MKPIIIIPSRLESTRLPNKPLVDIEGVCMILRCHQQAIKANIGPVIVATDSKTIAKVIRDEGGEVIMTSKTHESGTDRVYEAFSKSKYNKSHDMIINLQGDMPFIEPDTIKKVLEPLKNTDCDIATVVNRIYTLTKLYDANTVKAVLSMYEKKQGRALYFTRGVAPHGEIGCHYHHQGIYAFRKNALNKFVNLEQTPLEKLEKLEQLRALENGMRIDAIVVDNGTLSVDTPNDLEGAIKYTEKVK